LQYVNQSLQIQLELLMMSGVPLETCWAFNERWNNKFRYKVASCWLFLLNHTTMHGSMNIKFILWSHCKTDQVMKSQIWDMIGSILKVGYFYQENFSMHDRVWMRILPRIKTQKSTDVKHTNILTMNTNGNAGQVNFTMSIWSILCHTHLWYVTNIPHWIPWKCVKFPFSILEGHSSDSIKIFGLQKIIRIMMGCRSSGSCRNLF